MKPELSIRNRKEKGEAEVRFFIIVLILCGLLSGGLWILEFVKDSKNAKVQARREALFKKVEEPNKYPNGMYLVQCKRGIVDIMTNTFNCSVDERSFIERDVIDWHLGEKIHS